MATHPFSIPPPVESEMKALMSRREKKKREMLKHQRTRANGKRKVGNEKKGGIFLK